LAAARHTAWLLDRWLGGEEMHFYRERDLRRLIELHIEAAESEIDLVEGQGALNFLEMDDVPLNHESEIVDEDSIIQLDFSGERPVFPCIHPSATDSFLQTVNQSGKSWVVLARRQSEKVRAPGTCTDDLHARHLPT
jgi:metal transporter CNNM